MSVLGKWRITEMPDYEDDFADMMEPAYILFDDHGSGEFAFGCVTGQIFGGGDTDAVEFHWSGNDEMDEAQGHGWAEIQPHGSLEGQTASMAATKPTSSPAVGFLQQPASPSAYARPVPHQRHGAGPPPAPVKSRGGGRLRAGFVAAAVGLAAMFAPQLTVGAPRDGGVCAACVKATMQALAGDELRGRKCGGADENAAARYLADALAREHIAGGLPGGAYLQAVRLETPAYAAAPTLTFTIGGESVTLTHGREIVLANPPPAAEGDVVVMSDPNASLDVVQGKVVVLEGLAAPRWALAVRAGAAFVLTEAPQGVLARWGDLAARAPGPTQVEGTPPRSTQQPPMAFVRPEALAQLAGFAGGHARLSAPLGEPVMRTTYNVLGARHGKAADADRQAVLLSAHYDHLGVRNGVIFHGANDDASGSAAVVEFARMLGQGPSHKRTVYFAFFGCEEEGELGARRFMADPPIAVDDLVANLEFEMIGVDDPMRPGFLMLTGWDRTDLGPTLQAHGAKIGPDLYPEQNFFQRSDNFQLALRGVVAQTISAWPVTPTYHAPTDDLAHVDLDLMTRTIDSMAGPVAWLLDADYRPAWTPGKRP